MDAAMELLQSIADNGSMEISLLLTEQCSFECGHCCYSCGPHSRAGYMTNEVLDDVIRVRSELRSVGIYPSYNIIGGEPTLNMNEMRRCLDYLRHYGDEPIYITTNGWWFTSPYRRYQFFDTVLRYWDPYNEDFFVRISNDKYHDEFRKTPIVFIQNFLEEMDGWAGVCRCGYYGYAMDEDETCPDCGDETLRIPEISSGNPWIYVDSRPSCLPYAVGRGNEVGGRSASDLGPKCAGDYIGFYPNGDMATSCCIGGGQRFGTVKDHPLSLLGIAREYGKVIRGDCYSCDYMVEEFIETDLPDIRKRWVEVEWERLYQKINE